MPELFDIVLEEVSLVDAGDNQEAHVVFFKRHAQDPDALSDERMEELVKAALEEDGYYQVEVDKATKKEQGYNFPAAAFAYVPDSNNPSTWKLRLWESPTTKETAAQVGRAIAAIGKGFRGQKVQIPSNAMASVKSKIRAAWKRVNKDKS